LGRCRGVLFPIPISKSNTLEIFIKQITEGSERRAKATNWLRISGPEISLVVRGFLLSPALKLRAWEPHNVRQNEV
jgi:hypothetical protein